MVPVFLEPAYVGWTEKFFPFLLGAALVALSQQFLSVDSYIRKWLRWNRQYFEVVEIELTSVVRGGTTFVRPVAVLKFQRPIRNATIKLLVQGDLTPNGPLFSESLTLSGAKDYVEGEVARLTLATIYVDQKAHSHWGEDPAGKRGITYQSENLVSVHLSDGKPRQDFRIMLKSLARASCEYGAFFCVREDDDLFVPTQHFPKSREFKLV